MVSWIGVCVGLMQNNDDVLLGCPCARYWMYVRREEECEMMMEGEEGNGDFGENGREEEWVKRCKGGWVG